MGIVLLIVIGSVGLLALAIGLRGRRVGTAAHCRKCRFDLTGVYPEHLICPECGAGLEEPRATRTGRWVRRQKMLVAGVLLLGLAATLGTMSARGVVTKSKIARALPTGALVALTIDRPDGWLAAEGRSVLYLRVYDDKLSSGQYARLADALFGALSRPDFPEYRFHCALLNLVVENPSTPSGVRQQAADFLVDRVVRTDLPWVRKWGTALVRYRAQGLISDEVWESVLTELITPRLWCSSGGVMGVGGVVEPGEVFVVRTHFLADRLRVPLGTSLGPGVFLVRSHSVEVVTDPYNDGPLTAISQYGPGLPMTARESGEVLIARSEPGVGEFVVRSQYAEGMTSYADHDPRQGLSHPSTLTVESRLPIEVRPATPTAKQDDPPPTVEGWLQARLLPAMLSTRTVNEVFMIPGASSPPPSFRCRIAVLAPPGDLVLHGTLRVVDRDGTRTDLGTFDLQVNGKRSMAVWTPSGPGRRVRLNTQIGFGNYGVSTLPKLLVTLPAKYTLPGARAVLVFEEVTLPDGRTFDATQPGTAPIEIDVPFDPDAGGFDW